VALTGDGGDELLGGYNRHVRAPPLWRRLQKIPPSVRRALEPLQHSRLARLASLVPGGGPHSAERLSQALGIAAQANTFNDVYAGLVDQWHGQPSPVLGADGASPILSLDERFDDAIRLMHADAVDYLPGDILCKVDRASMAVSLETRVPFLDHRVAEVAARIPLSMKIRGRTGKVVLRQLLGQYLPAELFERKKAGFAVPVGEWMKGPLRDWAEDLFDRDRMSAEGWLDADIIHRRWRDHLSGRRDSTAALWAVLMFQAWLRKQR
jgi:asparagine synthase (glutamine-hydrolysing)